MHLLIQMLETYFWHKGSGHLLSMKNKQVLNSTDQRKIIQSVVDYMVEEFGVNVSIFERCITAFATVTLFPALKYKGSRDGTVNIFFISFESNEIVFFFL